jgi:hypothetical protein
MSFNDKATLGVNGVSTRMVEDHLLHALAFEAALDGHGSWSVKEREEWSVVKGR